MEVSGVQVSGFDRPFVEGLVEMFFIREGKKTAAMRTAVFSNFSAELMDGAEKFNVLVWSSKLAKQRNKDAIKLGRQWHFLIQADGDVRRRGLINFINNNGAMGAEQGKEFLASLPAIVGNTSEKEGEVTTECENEKFITWNEKHPSWMTSIY